MATLADVTLGSIIQPTPSPVEPNFAGSTETQACTHFNLIAGYLNGRSAIYPDINSFALWIPGVNRFTPKSLGLSVINVQGQVVDRIIGASGFSDILSCNFSLFPGLCESVGDCGSGSILVRRKLAIQDRWSIRLFLDDQRVYLGRVPRKPKLRIVNEDGKDITAYEYALEGWKAYADEVFTYGKVFEGVDVSQAVRVLALELASKTPVIYNPAKIITVGYTLKSQTFDGQKINQCLDTLLGLAGPWVWGVDVFGEFFFVPKETSPRHHFWLDRHPVTVTRLEEIADNIVNAVTIETSESSGGVAVRQLVEDTASIIARGRVEETIPMPSSGLPTTLKAVGATTILGPATWTDESLARDGNDTTFGEITVTNSPVNDFMDVQLNLNTSNLDPIHKVTGLRVIQGDDTGAGGYVEQLRVKEGLANTIIGSYDKLNQEFNLRFPPSEENLFTLEPLLPIAVDLPDIRLTDKGYMTRFDPIFNEVNYPPITRSVITTKFRIFMKSKMVLKKVSFSHDNNNPYPSEIYLLEVLNDANEIIASVQTNPTSSVSTSLSVREFYFTLPDVVLERFESYTFNISFPSAKSISGREPVASSTSLTYYNYSTTELVLANNSSIFPAWVPDGFGVFGDVLLPAPKYVWRLRELQFYQTDMSDALRFGQMFLDAYSTPYIEGAIELPPNEFFSPAPIRITDFEGNTDTYIASVLNYNIDKGIKVNAEFGDRAIKLENLQAYQNRLQELTAKRAEKQSQSIRKGIDIAPNAFSSSSLQPIPSTKIVRTS